MSVFDRIVMEIIKVMMKILLFTDLVLPKTSLPKCAFVTFKFGRGHPVATMIP